MEKEIDELREGYYYFQLLISNKQQADFQVKYVFKYCFLAFYIAFLMLILGLYFENNHYKVPISLRRNPFTLGIPFGIFLFGSYKLIVDPFFKKTMQKELNTNLEKELRKPRIIKFLLYFLASLLSLPAVMALFIYKIL
jgi:hypothetical protein